MIVSFELSMPNRGSWNGKWSGEKDRHIITKTDRQIGRKKCEELDGRDFFYRWPDGWTARVSCKVIDRKEAAGLKKQSKGFGGYEWMVGSIIRKGKIVWEGQ